MAANAQEPLRNTHCRADLVCPQMPTRMGLEQLLEFDHEFPMAMGGSCDRIGRRCRQALDNGLEQLLLHPMCCLDIHDGVRAHVRGMDRSRMELGQAPVARWSRAPQLRNRGDGQCDQSATSLTLGRMSELMAP